MRSKIISFMKPSKQSMVASNRITRFLSDLTGSEIEWDDSWDYKKPVDLLFIVNGAFAFSKYLPVIGKAVELAKNIIWVQNDYTIVPPSSVSHAESPFRKAFVIRKEKGLPDINFWTTVKRNSKKTELSRYINWNALTYQPLPRKLMKKLRKGCKDDAFYYGSFRKDRIPMFDRFFSNPRKCKIVVSSPSKKFQERYREIEIIPPIKKIFYKSLATHGIGLYLEDRKSSGEFHSPPNRFYEMLSAGLPMVFQKENKKMLRKAGFDVKGDYLVSSISDIRRAIRNNYDIFSGQQKEWGRIDYYDLLREKVLKEYKSIKNNLS